MPTIITIRSRVVPRHAIAFVEVYIPRETPAIESALAFQSRIVFLGRDSMLTADTVAAFAEANAFLLLAEDGAALNPGLRYRVEHFMPDADFQPAKSYATRLCWYDEDGNTQSKLLVTAPDDVLQRLAAADPGAPSRAHRRGTTARTPRRSRTTAAPDPR